ncbi:apolipoprotein N-acyltransferase [Sinirhodobacter sp. WL0062]|uniref:Apolipoprotein N-acyltransferase n=1 Tax=Rhodobacter flavimaris TaxID=2907145 RepID=A0ABS8YWP2_9RHOB|nr:apolipoprotein N-acyltransferase [Sinirhodobacter sp. WL0062]MCE5974221.1 apolipoprotein N-acyltransferase [Sinirhodobacter sp. WL0062]
MRLPRFLLPPKRPGWRQLGLAALLGAGVAAGQAPLYWWFAALPALSALIYLAVRSVSSGWIGFAAGFGYALAAMFWIVEPFFVEADRYGWMAPFALVLMAAGMGVFWALSVGLGARLGAGPALRALGAALGLVAGDALRSYVFTGFPWVLLGHIWIDMPVAQAAAYIGPLGLSLITAALAALPVAGRKPQVARIGIAAALLGVLWWGGAQRLATPDPARAEPVTLRLVQPNAPQHLKWLPEYRMEFFLRHLALTATPPEQGQPRPDLIIWPETAVPFLLERPGDGLEMIAEAASGVPVAIGVQRAEGRRYFNSLAVIDPEAQVTQVYDKVHLVPFGEYIPFGDLFARFGIAAFAAQEGNGYSAGPSVQVLDLGRLGLAQPLICYEAVFPQDIRRAPTRPDWLLQITNDAWFGDLSGPWQHFAQARLRAIEFGLPLARAANTGVSGMIDAKGRVLATLGMGREGVLDVPLPAALAPTPYARFGDAPILALILTLSIIIYRLRQRYRVDPGAQRV